MSNFVIKYIVEMSSIEESITKELLLGTNHYKTPSASFFFEYNFFF